MAEDSVAEAHAACARLLAVAPKGATGLPRAHYYFPSSCKACPYLMHWCQWNDSSRRKDERPELCMHTVETVMKYVFCTLHVALFKKPMH